MVNDNSQVIQQVKEARTYSVQEVCEILECSKKTVYRLCKNNYFVSKKIGKERRIIKSSFDSWLISHN